MRKTVSVLWVTQWDANAKEHRRFEIDRALALKFGAEIRDQAGHCDSCHEDHNEGYHPYDESWVYMGGDEQTPQELQFCCCQERIAWDNLVKHHLGLPA